MSGITLVSADQELNAAASNEGLLVEDPNLHPLYCDAHRLDLPARLGLFTKSRATFAAALGPDHPDTLKSMNNLASSYAATGQNDRALKRFEEALALRRAKLGTEHPGTLECLEGPAECLANTGQFDRAEAILDEAIASAP
jgi:tetratricopeptide (TPR) repeat protein